MTVCLDSPVSGGLWLSVHLILPLPGDFSSPSIQLWPHGRICLGLSVPLPECAHRTASLCVCV